jgi:large subunit ribosomal protein L5
MENKTKKTPKEAATSSQNKMRDIKIDKVVLNIGTKGEPERLKKAVSLLKSISKKEPVETTAKKRLAAWKIRPGLPIGSKVTIRGKAAEELIKRLLIAVDNKLNKKCFTQNGFSFGVPEYIDIPEVKYDPKIGIIGLDVCITLKRAGYRIKNRRIFKRTIPKNHTITKQDATKFAQNKLGVSVE